MEIFVKVHTNSSKEEVKKLSETQYEVWLKEKPINNRANEYLVKFLKKYFKKDIKMVSGFTNRTKKFEVKNG